MSTRLADALADTSITQARGNPVITAAINGDKLALKLQCVELAKDICGTDATAEDILDAMERLYGFLSNDE